MVPCKRRVLPSQDTHTHGGVPRPQAPLRGQGAASGPAGLVTGPSGSSLPVQLHRDGSAHRGKLATGGGLKPPPCGAGMAGASRGRSSTCEQRNKYHPFTSQKILLPQLSGDRQCNNLIPKTQMGRTPATANRHSCSTYMATPPPPQRHPNEQSPFALNVTLTRRWYLLPLETRRYNALVLVSHCWGGGLWFRMARRAKPNHVVHGVRA